MTGSSRNIGRAIALALADGGAHVMVTARQALADAEAVVREIETAGGAAAAMTADVGDPEGATRLVAATVERFRGRDMGEDALREACGRAYARKYTKA